MTPTEIRRWRPTRLGDFIGSRNVRAIARIRRSLEVDGRPPSPLLLVAPYGCVKTSLARRLLLGLNCSGGGPRAGDPCLTCPQCLAFGPAYNRTGSPYLRLEFDCTHAGRQDVISLCDDFRLDANAAIFLDELHHLHERNSQEALLKFLEDFPGVLVAAVMSDRYGELSPPLRERFETIRLEPPSEDEVVAFLSEKCSGEFGIRAEVPVLRALVRASGLSFRICLKVLAAAAERNPRLLDRALVVDFLGGAHASSDPDLGREERPSHDIEEDGEFYME